jgi:aminopeptidase N
MIGRSERGEIASTDYRVDVPAKLGFAAAPYHVFGRGMCTILLLQEDSRANDIADGCQRTVTALTHIWGDLPRGNVKIVEVDFKSILLGVGESGYILADSSEIRRDFELNYWAHELSHQWWGSSVHAKYPSPGNSLLTEGLAEFGALSVNRELHGKQGEADYLSDRLAHEASGAPLAHYVTILARHEDEALTSNSEDEGSRLHYLVTSKGVIAIAMLADEIGLPLFYDLCKEFLKLHANESTTWADLKTFLEGRTSRDLGWFYTQWFDQPGLPQLYTTWAQAGDGIDVTLHQCAPSYRLDRFPIQVRMSDPDGTFRSSFLLGDFGGAKSTVHFEGVSGAYRVNPDPNRTFLWLPGLCVD